MWEGVGDRTELQHIDPHSYGHQCFFPVLLMLLNRRPGGPLRWVLAFSTTSCLQLLVSKLTDFPSSSSYIIVQSPTQYFWNGIFDRHQAEITVMQFTGHSLLVHHSMTVLWDFNPVPYCQPDSPTPMEYALPLSLEWHVWRGRRSIYYTCALGQFWIVNTPLLCREYFSAHPHEYLLVSHFQCCKL